MASPVDAGRATSTSGTSTDPEPLTVSLPGSIASGDLLVMFIGLSNGSVPTATGWTDSGFSPPVPGGHDNAWQYVLTRVADGSEGSTVDVGIAGASVSVRWAAIVWRITGAATSGTIFQIGTEVTADSINLQPCSVTPSGGSKDYLFIIMGIHIGAIASQPTAAPTNYSNFAVIGSGGTGSTSTKVNVAGVSRQLTASSETSPLWSMSSRELNGDFLVAIYPAAAGQYTDSATVLVDIQPDDVETFDALDSSTVPMVLGVSATELREITDSATVLIDIQTSGTEFPAKEYTDAATPSVKLTPSGTELREVTDAAIVPVVLTPSGTELRETTEAATVLIDIQASGTDVYGQIGATAPFIRQPMIVGGIAIQDRSRW